MKLSPEQFDALIGYINAKAQLAATGGVARSADLIDKTIGAYKELEAQLKGDRDEQASP